MATPDQFGRWDARVVRIGRGDLVGARDALVECLYQAQHETFMHQKERLGVPSDESSVRQSIVGAVRAALSRVGGSYEAPTRAHLRAALDVLAVKARTWGTPPDIIEYHRSEMIKVLDSL